MKNFKPTSTTRFASIVLLATGVLTGAFLTADWQYSTAIAEMEIDPAIPALVVVGKRLTRQATAAPTDGHGQSTMAVQDGAAPRTGSAHVVFITAYDQYAIEAFEHGAVDYVLKPAERERLKTTVERLKLRLQKPPGDIGAVLAQLASQIAPKPSHLQWIQASIGQELRLIAVADILFFQSDEKYTRVQTSRFEALIRKPVRDLIDELDPALFWQIHRSTLVNVHAIDGVTRDLRGRHLVLIKGQPDKLEVSRSFVHLFKQT